MVALGEVLCLYFVSGGSCIGDLKVTFVQKKMGVGLSSNNKTRPCDAEEYGSDWLEQTVFKWIPLEKSENRATSEDLVYLHNLMKEKGTMRCDCFETTPESNATHLCEDCCFHEDVRCSGGVCDDRESRVLEWCKSNFSGDTIPEGNTSPRYPRLDSPRVSFKDRKAYNTDCIEGENNNPVQAGLKATRRRKLTPYQDKGYDLSDESDLDEADDELSTLPNDILDQCHKKDVDIKGQSLNKKLPFVRKGAKSKLLEAHRVSPQFKAKRCSYKECCTLTPVDCCCYHANTSRDPCTCGSDAGRNSHGCGCQCTCMPVSLHTLLDDKHRDGILVREEETKEITPMARPHANSFVIHTSSRVRVYKYPLKKSRSLPVIQCRNEDIAKHF